MRFVFHLYGVKINTFFVILMSLSVLAFSCAPRPSGPAQTPDQTWLNIPLKDVRTDKQFKLSDFKGKVVLLETMAVWCTTCVRQQIEIKKVDSRFRDEVVSISLDIDPNENEAILQKHALNNGFDWYWAVSSTAMSQQLERAFGNAILNPPSTPMVIIDRNQSPHLLRFGVKSAEELVREIEKYR
ncbi:MAG: redoxin family protein [Candidatus Tectomicrobia bacterium]|uniref:Redoxin family protein n=1 Tax=Tectimicrobiota bacterium TaxID=2528274 RepID=A0A933GM54_UNCTE|nr:redoxin family protein [Candidatus Tectomicrobia bacterium]